MENKKKKGNIRMIKGYCSVFNKYEYEYVLYYALGRYYDVTPL